MKEKKETKEKKPIISKELILATSKELLRTEGWDSMNIRKVAKTCGISIGTVYNYFDDKTELVTATIANIWTEIFHSADDLANYSSFMGCIHWLFDCLKNGDEKFPDFYTRHSISFLDVDTDDGQVAMKHSWMHIKNSLHRALVRDESFKEDRFDETFTPEIFVDIIFSLILAAMIHRNYDTAAIQGLVDRILN